MQSWENYYRGENYKKYFFTRHWIKLNDVLIDSNPDACCFICYLPSKLLLHHVTYENLFHEKLYRDVYILCFDCHTEVHFWLFGRVKVPLTPFWLLFSLRLRKLLFCVQSKEYGLLLLYSLTVVITGFIHLICFLFGELIMLTVWTLKKSLSTTAYLLNN